MKFQGCRFNLWKKDWYILPGLQLFFNDPIYARKNFSIGLHFLCFHVRWFWLER